MLEPSCCFKRERRSDRDGDFEAGRGGSPLEKALIHTRQVYWVPDRLLGYLNLIVKQLGAGTNPRWSLAMPPIRGGAG